MEDMVRTRGECILVIAETGKTLFQEVVQPFQCRLAGGGQIKVFVENSRIARLGMAFLLYLREAFPGPCVFFFFFFFCSLITCFKKRMAHK